jgi:ABC-type multidrug transport system fused ATPase/permease subunit
MVAHRLDSLLDFDRVVVLDAGRVVEFDGPKALLADGNSAFSRLYRGGGKVE